MAHEQAVHEDRLQEGDAFGDDAIVEAAEVSLVASLHNHGREAVGEGLTRKPPVPRAGGQPVDGDGEAVLHHRLVQQRMDELRRSGPLAVAAEEAGVDELTDLPGLRRRQIRDAVEPRMQVIARLRRRRAPGEGVAHQRPCGMPGPAGDGGGPARIETGQALPPQPVDDHGGVGGLEEDGVAALSGHQGGRAGAERATRHHPVVRRIQTVERRPQAETQRRDGVQRPGADRLADAAEGQAGLRGHRPGEGPLVAFGPVVVEVEDLQAVRPRLSGQAGGHDGGIQPARNLHDQPVMRRERGDHRRVHHFAEPVRVVVPGGGRGPGRTPDRTGFAVTSDEHEVARRDSSDAGQRRLAGRPGEAAQQSAERIPVDGHAMQQPGVQHLGEIRSGEREPVLPYADAVEGAAGIPQQGEATVVAAPGGDIAAPPARDDGRGEPHVRPRFGDEGGERGVAAPAADEDMAPVHLDDREPRPGSGHDAKAVDVERRAPSRRQQEGAHGAGAPGSFFMARVGRQQQPGVDAVLRRDHRTYTGV